MSWLLGLGIALLFGIAAGHKLADRERLVALLAAYALAIAINLLRGRTRIDCGCLGFGRHDRIAWTMVARNLVLIALALALLLPASPRRLVAFDVLTISASLAAIALLVATLVRLGALPVDRRGAP